MSAHAAARGDTTNWTNLQPEETPLYETPDQEDTGSPADRPISSLVKSRLYISHTLSTFNDRVFEFASILFIVEIFPNTLLPSSVYAIFRSAAAIFIAPYLGRYVDSHERLGVVRRTIVFQRLAVLGSSVVFLGLMTVLKDSKPSIKWTFLMLTVVLASIERLCAITNTIAVERDWVVIIADGNGAVLEALNSQMRRIDLLCKLLGPLLISLLGAAGVSLQECLLFIMATNVISVNIEYFTITKVYALIPALAIPKESLFPSTSKSTSSLTAYFGSHFFLPSFALALLYLTVLSFAGTTTAYLLSQDLTPTIVGLLRTVSIVFEVSATFIAPLVQQKIGSVRAALWFINWQLFSVIPILLSFVATSQFGTEGKKKWVLAVMIPLSRVGLWGFDLCVRSIIQEGVPSGMRGSFSATEASFQNLFELMGYATTLIFFKPEQLTVPVAISVGSIALAGAVYAAWVRKERGHLVHCYLEKFGFSDCGHT